MLRENTISGMKDKGAIVIERLRYFEPKVFGFYEKLYENRKKNGSKSVFRWDSGENMFWWWLTDKDKSQLEIFELKQLK